MTRDAGRIAMLVLASGYIGAWAQVFKFEDIPIPNTREMKGLYTFYVYSKEKAPMNRLGKPQIIFSDFTAELLPGGQAPPFKLEEYEGLQVSLMKWSAFNDLVNPVQFCSCRNNYWQNEVVLQLPSGKKKEDVGVYDQAIPFKSKAQEFKTDINEQGVYVLMFTNCGNFTAGTVSGTVSVQQPYGFLPGNEYRKLGLYMGLFVGYAIIGLIWAVLCSTHCDQILPIQKGIGLLVLLGISEVGARYMMLFQWNTDGELPRITLNAAILLAMWKRVLSFTLVLATAQGWGVLTPDLTCGTKIKMALVAVVYTVMSSVQEVVLTFRFSHMLNSVAVIGGSAPTEVMHTMLVLWILCSLSRSIHELAGVGESERMKMFVWLRRIVISVIIVGGCTVAFEFYEMKQSIGARWEVDWFARAGISHMLFLWILVAMMFLWAPGARSKGYGYVPGGVDGGGDEMEAPPNAEEETEGLEPQKIGNFAIE